MATYYPDQNSERDALPCLYMRDPGSGLYTDSPSLTNDMLYLNYSSGGSYTSNMDSNAQGQLNSVELLAQNMLSQDPSQSTPIPISSQSAMYPNLACGLWRDGRNEMLFMQPAVSVQDMDEDLGNSKNSQVGISNQLELVHEGSNASPIQSQVLSLSLSTQIPSAIPLESFQFPPGTTDISFAGPHPSGSAGRGDSSSNVKQQAARYFLPGNPDLEIRNEQLKTEGAEASRNFCSNSDMFSAFSSIVSSSKYLKVAQELLDEVVNLKAALKPGLQKHQNFGPVCTTALRKADDVLKAVSAFISSPRLNSDNQEASSSSKNGLTFTERQEMQNKLTKLLAMCDEVDRRYKHYYQQMQITVASFDVIAGPGAAKPYTELALQTISRHFRCLRDAIKGQIQTIRKNLGEHDGLNGKGSGAISRLRFIDTHLKQQRALQQTGIVHQHAWRPQRGLPESAVSILRAWLFEHFLHPYPKDSDKIMLARQTGLTRSQVSNWFINARVRLWKPMVEEMYKEEIGDAEIDSNSSSENAFRQREGMQIPDDKEYLTDIRHSWHDKSQTSSCNDAKSDNISDVEQKNEPEDCCLVPEALVHADDDGRFMGMGYPVSDMTRYDNGGVSLTLGLQHCDNETVPLSGVQPGFITLRNDDMYGSADVCPTGSGDYDCLNIVNRQPRFGPSHFLHDFVA